MILEVPASTATVIGKWFDEHRTLKGYKLVLQRVSKKINARVRAVIFPGQAEEKMLPKAVPLIPLLLRMWEVQQVQTALPIDDGPRLHVQKNLPREDDGACAVPA